MTPERPADRFNIADARWDALLLVGGIDERESPTRCMEESVDLPGAAPTFWCGAIAGPRGAPARADLADDLGAALLEASTAALVAIRARDGLGFRYLRPVRGPALAIARLLVAWRGGGASRAWRFASCRAYRSAGRANTYDGIVRAWLVAVRCGQRGGALLTSAASPPRGTGTCR